MTYTTNNVSLDKLELIAQHQTVSPKAEDVKLTPIEQAEPLPLDVFMKRSQEFFSKGLSEVSKDQEDSYLTWSAELILFLGKTCCRGSHNQLAFVLGYTKNQALSVIRRIRRHVEVDSDLVTFLWDYRCSIYGLSG